MRERMSAASGLLPGLALTAGVAWLGLAASGWIGRDLLGFEKSPVSGIMLAIVLGMVVGNVFRLPEIFTGGIKFSLARVLRLGIILLGIRLGLGEALKVGALAVPLIVLCIVVAGLITYWLGKRLALPRRMTVLIAVGTSICGATAIMATAPAIGAEDEETAYAVANITVFGIVAMLLYPYLADGLFGQDPASAGRFLGTAIHETAQVAGSGLIHAQVFGGDEVLNVATVTKLMRNLFMVAVIPLMAYWSHRMATNGGVAAEKLNVLDPFPLFILGFVALAVVRTVGDATLDSGSAFGVFDAAAWGDLTGEIKRWAERFLGMAMAGVGLGTSIHRLQGLGPKPFCVGLGAALAVGAVSLLGIAGLNFLGVG
ncbi:MAG: putative sulfate exporter family transporter [Chloroflexota bacterium]|nr:putative sulfate exporter family transporter [Chloroflexota bacterium]MDP6757762.1 putative sulfate exporter family transporter [Chloroflexota bacterium]